MNIFDSYINEMQKAPHLLTRDNVKSLRSLIPDDMQDASFDSNNLIEMGKVMKKLIEVAERMYADALMSSGDDNSAEMKAAANALKQAMDVAIRYTDKINASDRAIKVENALVAVLKEFSDEERDPEIMRRFNTKLKKMLADG